MDKTLISAEEAAVSESEPSGKEQPDDVTMEETENDSKADAELPGKVQSEPAPENVDNLCTVCGFSAKCPRSLKIHYARKHGNQSKTSTRGAKEAEQSENVSDVSSAELQQDVNMETESAGEVKQNQQTDLDKMRAATDGDGTKTKSSDSKETALDKQSADQEDGIQTQERRSKRTPKPKMIHSCNYCGQEFRDKSPLDVHIQRYHAKHTPYTCECLLLSLSNKAAILYFILNMLFISVFSKEIYLFKTLSFL